jgi:hypothetical protein
MIHRVSTWLFLEMMTSMFDFDGPRSCENDGTQLPATDLTNHGVAEMKVSDLSVSSSSSCILSWQQRLGTYPKKRSSPRSGGWQFGVDGRLPR